jgi:hypothetical protein
MEAMRTYGKPDRREPVRRLKGYDDSSSEDLLFSEDHRRFKIVEAAVAAADSVIIKQSSGSEEETAYLTAEVARKFMHKVSCSINARLHIKELLEYGKQRKDEDRE